MYLILSRHADQHVLGSWFYGSKDDGFIKGSGLYVSENGDANYHHFLSTEVESVFHFSPGPYQLEVFAHLLGDAEPKLLFSENLEIDEEWRNVFVKLHRVSGKRHGVCFEWEPEKKQYAARIEETQYSAIIS